MPYFTMMKPLNSRYGVAPDQIADLKALKGDPSDNIPGVPGVGDKTALKLVQQFGRSNTMLDHLDEVEPAKLKGQAERECRTGQSEAKCWRPLSGRRRSLWTSTNAARLDRYDRSQVAELFRELGFNSLLAKLPESTAAEQPPRRAPPPDHRR